MAALFVVMAVISGVLAGTNLNRFALGMCTALVALSLVPLIGWAGQVSLAPLAFAGHRRGRVRPPRRRRRQHPRGAPRGASVAMPVGALLAFPALRLQGLYLALATLAFASWSSQRLLHPAVRARGPDAAGRAARPVRHRSTSTGQSFLLLVTVGVRPRRRSASSRSGAARSGRRLVALRDSEAASATVGVNVLETKVAVFMLSAGMAGFAGAFLAMYYETTDAQQFQMLARAGHRARRS